jgi:predicted nucleic acid-binding protein
MRIYLDTCTIQRPVDESREPRVQREAAAMLELIELVKAGEVELVRSRGLQVEHAHNSDRARRVFVERVLSLAGEIVDIDRDVEERTLKYRALGVKGMDAVHLACAVKAAVDILCTCDDRFAKRARRVDTGLTRVLSPLELIQEVKK